MTRAIFAAGALALATSMPVHAQTVLFEQPSYTDGIADHFSATGQPKPWNPKGIWYLHANQAPPEPSTYLPVAWNVGALTGLECPPPLGIYYQVGIGNVVALPGHTAAQVCGAMGAYLDSADLYLNSPGQRMMIAPQIKFRPTIQAFPSATSTLSIALDLQVPSATTTVVAGAPPSTSNCYAKMDLLFTEIRSGGRMSLSVGIFGLGVHPKADGAGFDNLTNTAIADAWVLPLSHLVTLARGSAQFRSAPWIGMQHFAFSVDTAQFAKAIAYARKGAAGQFHLSAKPSDYVLAGAHLNAELHYTATTPTTLGWSMSGLTILQSQ